VEALGQHVQQEAPDELVRVKPHRLPAVGAADAIVLPAERNRLVVGCNEAAVGTRDKSLPKAAYKGSILARSNSSYACETRLFGIFGPAISRHFSRSHTTLVQILPGKGSTR
jgi:hypothetical protein